MKVQRDSKEKIKVLFINFYDGRLFVFTCILFRSFSINGYQRM